jgi:hypothetical protein
LNSYLDTVALSEKNIEFVTNNALFGSQLGVRAPRMIALMGDAIERLTLIASCANGCKHKDHVVENLVRRCVNLSLAALKLGKVGYYDEALLLVRSGAEIANLLQLFSVVPDAQDRWRVSSEGKEFRPVQVRLAIEKTQREPFTHKNRYRALSARAAHTTHEFALTSHGEGGHVGPWFAAPGFLLTFAETFDVARYCVSLAADLTEQTAAVQKEFQMLSHEMYTIRSPITIENYDAALFGEAKIPDV